MEYRIGKCSSCSAEYKIPGSFQHDSAKCKMCGGVVAIGPVVQAEDAAKPAVVPKAPKAAKAPVKPVAPVKPIAKAKPVVPPKPVKPAAAARPPVPAKPVAKAAPPARPVPVAPAPSASASPAIEPIPVKKKKREGPSMKEQLLARRREAEAAAQAAAKPATSRPKPAARPTAAAAPARRPAAAGAAVGAAAKATSSSSRKRSSGGRSARGGSVSSGGSRRGGRNAPRRESSKAPLWIGLGAFALAAGGGAFAFKDTLFGGAGEAQAAETVEATDATEAAIDEVVVAAVDDASEANPAETATAEPDKDEAPSAADGPVADAEPEAEPEQPAEEKGNPDSVDLTALEPFGPPDNMSDEDWKELQRLAAEAFDPMSGAAGPRAAKALKATPRGAFPAIVNVMLGLDVSTTDGQLVGGDAQRLLEEFGKGKNFGWKFTLDREDVYFNKKVIMNWHKTWAKLEGDLEQWKGFAKLTDEEYAELLATLGQGDASDSVDVDDEDLFDVDD